jgi:hypothetical protein
MKAGEESKAWDINEFQPYARKYNLLSQKAGAKSAGVNAGITNLFSGLQNWDNYNKLKTAG